MKRDEPSVKRTEQGIGEAENRINTAMQEKLTQLDLSCLGLTDLPQSIGQLDMLESLDLSYNELSVLPQALLKLKSLKKLKLNSNRFTNLPDAIGLLAQLEILNISHNELSRLPASISELACLKSLVASNNEIVFLPYRIALMKELKILDLSYNHLATLPTQICQLSRLHTLNLRYNGLRNLPACISDLKNLKRLLLFSNNFKALPDKVCDISSLERLELSGNYLPGLPERIGRLINLKYLSLNGNKIVKLPDNIKELKALEELLLSSNELSMLPNYLDKLGGLIHLNISRNKLTSLPDQLGYLINLRLLDVSYNNLGSLPDSLESLSNLEGLFLHGNKALGLPPEILGPTWPEVRVYWKKERKRQNAKMVAIGDKVVEPADPSRILEYYLRIRGGSRPLNEAKLILVGRGGTGKTSLVNGIVHDKTCEIQEPTKGINITKWRIMLENSTELTLNVWDFGGQEIMHGTHQFFLSERSLYLLVLNGREGLEDYDADYWLRMIESFGHDSRVIVVLNKIQQNPFDVNRTEYKRKYPWVKEFVETDCSDRTGYEELRAAIKRQTGHLGHLNDLFPARWLAIKHRLSNMHENYLKYDQYRTICAQYGEPDIKAQDSLASYLHLLGIALNYRDDGRLFDTHVLNPHWVTNGIYDILNSKRLMDQQGEIKLENLQEILDQETYPASMHPFLFNLMEKFGLCFQFPDVENHYLVPELLSLREPDDTTELVVGECLNFEYHYPVLPEGLLPRFIVRTRTLSTMQARWRTGVVLKFEMNIALVKADITEKKVSISIGGPTEGRRNLLAIIRFDFNKIHSEIKFLKAKEMVPLPFHPGHAVPYQDLLVMEGAGHQTVTRVIDGGVEEFNVRELLNGVDYNDGGVELENADEAFQSLLVFYSYSRKDESFRNELETHLKLMVRRGFVETWYDRRVDPSEEWERHVRLNLDKADIVLLLVSSDFLASNYCYEVEMTRALERHNRNEACVVPIIVRDVDWNDAPFARLQVLPTDGVPVAEWNSRDSAWRNVSEGIKRIVKEIRKRNIEGQ